MALGTIQKEKARKAESFSLRPYDHSFDAALAEMWNESDDQWPGTFNHGVPLNEDRVREWMDRVGAIMRLVVEQSGTGKVVGYGDLWDDLARPGSCYVSLLNVHPDFQKRSLARRMLVSMVDWAVEHDYDRVSIGTWSSNLKAVPLYKKTGFFWQPGTNVHMENYIPAVRLVPALAGFFERNDWYRDYVRELSQREDVMRHPRTGGMSVYVLRWEAGDELVEAVVDRNAQAITGLRTENWSVYAQLTESEPVQGLSYPVKWDLANTSARPLAVTLATQGDKGIEVDLQADLVLQPGESRQLESSFKVAVDAPDIEVHNHEVPTPKLITRLTINGQDVQLGSGLRYRPAVEFSLEPEVVSLTPGQPKTVLLQLQNRLKGPLKGDVRLNLPEGLEVDWHPETLELALEGTAGIPLTLMAKVESFFELGVAFEFDRDGQKITTRAKQLPVVAIQPGGWAAGKIGDRLILENDTFRLTTRAKSGHSELFSKIMGRVETSLGEELGLPFVPWDLAEQTYEMVLDTSGHAATATLTVRSTRFPGLLVGREISLSGSPVLRVSTWVRNESDQAVDELAVRPMSRYRRSDLRFLVAPLLHAAETRIVREQGGEFNRTDGDIPEEPEKFGEGWLALEQPGYVYGTVWSFEGLEKIGSWRGDIYLVYQLGELGPNDTFRAPDLYVYSGPGDWHTIQALWQRLNELPPSQPEEALPAPAGRHFEIGIEPNPILTMDGEVTASLYAHTTREHKVYGKLAVQPPAGWQVDVNEAALDGMDFQAPFEQSLTLRTSQNRPGVYQGLVRLESRELDAESPFSLIRLGNAGQPVRLTPAGDVWRLENGRTTWEISPAFSGAVVRWQEAGSEVNHLKTSYPDPGQLSWIKPWFGGLRPVLFDYVRDEDWPGKLHESRFEARPAESVDEAGLNWIGLRLEAAATAPEFTGLRLEIDYLTLGGSNLLKVRYRVINETALYRKAEAALMSFFQVDGTHENAVMHAEGLQRKRTPIMAWPHVGSWVGIENPDTGRTMTAVVASGFRRLLGMDWGLDGGHAYVMDYFNVPPHASQDLIAYYALAETLEEARSYEALSQT